MSAIDFTNRLRLVASLIPPGEFDPAGPPATPDGVRQHRKALASADVWLDPAFLADADPADFWQLDDAGRGLLAERFAYLRDLSAAAARGEPPTPEQAERGLRVFVGLVEALLVRDEPDRQLLRALWDTLEPKYPDLVYGFGVSFGSDWSGDPSVTIEVVFPDETILGDPGRFDAVVKDVKQAAWAWLGARQLPHWPYTNLLTLADMKAQLVGVEA